MEYAIVVDKNDIVLSIIKKWLFFLGFKNVFTYTLANDGLRQLRKLKDDEIIPIVFLGYDIDGMSCLQFIRKAFDIITDLVIIIETTHDISEPFIKDLFANGVFHYIKKPIRFEQLKTLIQTIKEEYELLNSGYNSIAVEVELLLKRSQRLSITKLSQLLGVQSDTVLPILTRLMENGKIKMIGLTKEIACNNCKSVLIITHHCCPQCQSINFKYDRIIEHYKCGNVAPQSDYPEDICPKCDKKLKEFGLDYRVMLRFLCEDCKDISENLQILYLCESCGKKFQIDDAEWETSESFISLIDVKTYPSNTRTEFEQLENIVTDNCKLITP